MVGMWLGLMSCPSKEFGLPPASVKIQGRFFRKKEEVVIEVSNLWRRKPMVWVENNIKQSIIINYEMIIKNSF